jgi:hypothetical protein
MSVKLKNEASDQQSLRTHLQNFIGHGKTLQIHIEASPNECLTWVESLAKTPPGDFRFSIESQEVKRPYQFTARVSAKGYRGRTELGVVVGDIIQSSISDSKSIVTLRFYHTIGSILSGVTVAGLCMAMAIPMILSSQAAITPRMPSRFYVEEFLCYGGIAIFFIGMGIFAVIKLLNGNQPLDMIIAHLLKLNVEPTKAD